MPEVRPFCGLRFDPAVAGCLDAVITPPYDVISPEQRDRLAADSPLNMTHVILPKPGPAGESPYDHAAAVFGGWRASGALKQDPAPSHYLLRQTFNDSEGRLRVRRAFFAAVRLPEAGERCILGHERTFDKPFEDRLSLTRATRTSLGAVFLLYSDPSGALEGFLNRINDTPPDLAATTFEGVRQELWRVAPDPAVAPFLADQTLYIADGHHRFRTACAYRDEMRAKTGAAPGSQPFDYALAGFVAFEDPGLEVHATHRIVPECPLDTAVVRAALAPWFGLSEVSGDPAAALRRAGEGAFVMFARGAAPLLLTFTGDRTALLGGDRGPAWRELDVALLHRGILERILGLPANLTCRFAQQPDEARAAVEEGGAALAFLVRATPPAQIRACAEAGEPMPQKSTYFFPKLCTGAVMLPLE